MNSRKLAIMVPTNEVIHSCGNLFSYSVACTSNILLRKEIYFVSEKKNVSDFFPRRHAKETILANNEAMFPRQCFSR